MFLNRGLDVVHKRKKSWTAVDQNSDSSYACIYTGDFEQALNLILFNGDAIRSPLSGEYDSV